MKNIDLLAVEKYLDKLQQDPRIWEVKLYNISIWPIIKWRLYIFGVDSTEEVGIKKIFSTKQITWKIKYFKNLLLAYYDYWRIKFNNDSSSILFFFADDRARIEKNDIFEPFVQSLFDDFDIIDTRYRKIVLARNRGRSKLRANYKYYIRENIIKFPTLSLLRSKKSANDVRIIAKDLLRIIKEKESLDIFTNMILKFIDSKEFQSYVLFQIHQINKAKRFLVKLRVRKIVYTSNEANTALLIAANNLGIDTIEIQHGLIHQTHPSYSWPKNVERAIIPIGKYMACQGKYFSNILIEKGLWSNGFLFTIGNLNFEKGIVKYKKKEKVKTSNYIILYTSNPSMVNEEIDFLIRLAELFILDKNVKILYKLHPVFIAEGKKISRSHPKISVVNKNELIMELFAKTDLHLSIYSAAVFESLEMGIPTGTIPLNGNNILEPLHEDNTIIKFTSAEQIKDFVVNDVLNEQIKLSLLEQKRRFYAPYNHSEIINVLIE